MTDKACVACDGIGKNGFWGDKAWVAIAVIGKSAGVCVRCYGTCIEPENETQFRHNVELMRQLRLTERQAIAT